MRRAILPAVGIAVTVVTVLFAMREPAIVLGALAAIALLVFGYLTPRGAVGTWLVVVLFVPSWTSLTVAGFSLNPVHVGLPVALGIIASRRSIRQRFTMSDAALLAATVAVVLLQVVTPQPTWLLFNLVATLLLSYFFGRSLGMDLARAFAGAIVVLAAWGIVEFAFGIHLFTEWFPGAGSWGGIQTRGGLSRSEATLGHAIAYGGVLALGLPFARHLKHPAIAQIIIIGGVLTSISRGPMLAMVLTLAVGAVVSLRGTKRFWAVTGSIAAGIAVYFVFDELYSGSAASEVNRSGGGRVLQLSQTIGLLSPFGAPPGAVVSPTGVITVQDLEFIDSTPLRLAINFGVITAALVLIPMLITMASVFRKTAGPATIAIVGQVPILLVTSLITQWQAVLFFVLGMAVTELSRRNDESADPALEKSRAGTFV